MNDKYEKPLEANCETKDSVFSDDEENDLLDSASMNKRPKKKDQPLEVLSYCRGSSFCYVEYLSEHLFGLTGLNPKAALFWSFRGGSCYENTQFPTHVVSLIEIRICACGNNNCTELQSWILSCKTWI